MRYLGSKCKRCRAVGASVCGRLRCAWTRKPNPPGQHGADRKKRSEYAKHLLEKQKVRWSYGISERQFYKIFQKASKSKDVTGTVLLQLLESRLDNILYRSGFIRSRAQARQFVSHGHLQINDKKVTIPSMQLRPGDVVVVREKSRPLVEAMGAKQSNLVPEWLTVDKNKFAIEFVRLPERYQLDQSFQENLVIEYYSR